MNIIKSFFPLLFVFMFSSLVYSQQLPPPGSAPEVVGIFPNDLPCKPPTPYLGGCKYVMPILANEDYNDSSWVIDLEYTVLSGSVAEEENDYPINGPFPDTNNAFLILITPTVDIEITFKIYIGGILSSSSSYIVDESFFPPY